MNGRVAKSLRRKARMLGKDEGLLVRKHTKRYVPSGGGEELTYYVGTLYHHPRSFRAVYQALKRLRRGLPVHPRAVPK